MSDFYFGFVTSVLAIGGLVGSIFSSKLTDSLGRKKSLILNSAILFVGSIFEAISFSPFMLVLGRLISGIGAGIGFVIVPMYLTEIAPLESRGFLNMFFALSLSLGIFISQLIGYFLNTGKGWRVVLGTGICISFLNGIFLFYIVESPKYLCEKAQEEESKFSLRKLRGKNNVEDEYDSWICERENNGCIQNGIEPRSYLNRNVEQIENINEIEGIEQKLNLISILRVKKYRQPIILVWDHYLF
ncbi:Sugar transport protein 1 [Smittium mucronatum]|uniref:Sugar transport protein 1 n=1 Tax=Smittium mucronatum TaxID=133383 RepID=A0A1R0H8U4_9FUNG|nr:Sugar transport protein 1 [Smittium mucronatum]